MEEKKEAREERNREKLANGDWDIDQESALADFYTIEMYPTFILMRKGEQLWRQSGELPLEKLEKAVKEYELKA